MRRTKARLGDWLMTCERSGKVYPRSEMKQEWTGAWVHRSKWEARHPQDIIKSIPDNQSVFPSNKEDELVFVDDYIGVPVQNNFTSTSSIDGAQAIISQDGYSFSKIADGKVSVISTDKLDTGSEYKCVRIKFDQSNFVNGDSLYLGFSDESTGVNLTSLQLVYDIGNAGMSYYNGSSWIKYNSGTTIYLCYKSNGDFKAIINGTDMVILSGITTLKYFNAVCRKFTFGADVFIDTTGNQTSIPDFTYNAPIVINYGSLI